MDQVARRPFARPLPVDRIPGWADDHPEQAFEAFRASAARIVVMPPKTRALGIDGRSLLAPAMSALEHPRALDHAEARAFFERWFEALPIEAAGHVTSYYEPVVTASPVRTTEFPAPLLRRPTDLIDIDDAIRPAGMDPEMRFGRRGLDASIAPYLERAAIEEGALDGQGLEIAWLRDAVTAFFIHVQGSARLCLPDGRMLRVAFAAKSGHPYTSVGKLAIAEGLLAPDRADKEHLEALLRSDPRLARRLIQQNRSYIFFSETGQFGDEGPMGAAGVPLAAGRSLAVDRTLMTFHVPIFVSADTLRLGAEDDGPFQRLMIAQDTGSAIVGPARGDIFAGSGDAAGRIAGRVNHPATFHVLVPRGA